MEGKMAASKRRMYLLALLSVLTSTSVLDAAFTSTPGTVTGCVGDSATLTWDYDNAGDASTVVWDFGLTNVFNYQPPTGNTVQGAAQFSGRVTHNGGGSITLGTLTTNDAGVYTCTVTYTSISNPAASNDATLVVKQPFTDSISTVLTVSGSSASVTLGSQSGVNVEWKNEAGTVVGRDTTYTGEGKITVCLIGCVSGSAAACQQIDLKSGGLSETACIVIVVVIVCVAIITAVVMVILWKKRLLCFKECNLGPGAIAVIVVAVLVGGVVIPVVVMVILWKEKKLCFKDSRLGSFIGVRTDV